MSSAFNFKSLINLIKVTSKPYLNNQELRFKNLLLPVIEEELKTNLRDLLANHSQWPLDTFLALTCGFLFTNAWKEEGTISFPDVHIYKSDETKSQNIYHSSKYYLLEEKPDNFEQEYFKDIVLLSHKDEMPKTPESNTIYLLNTSPGEKETLIEAQFYHQNILVKKGWSFNFLSSLGLQYFPTQNGPMTIKSEARLHPLIFALTCYDTTPYKNSYILFKDALEIYFINYYGVPYQVKAKKSDVSKLIKNANEDNLSKFLYESRLESALFCIKSTYKQRLELIPKTESTGFKRPVEWLKLVQMDPNRSPIKALEKAITLHHFGLDEEKVEGGLDPDVPLDIKQTAGFLSEKLEEDIKPHQVLHYCRKANSFNVYISNGYMTLKRYLPLPTITEIESAIENGYLKNDYKYPFQKLIRINSQTLDHLSQEGNKVRIGDSSLEYSISEYVTNLNYITKKEMIIDIPRDELRFIKEELIEFAEKLNYQNNLKKFDWEDFYSGENAKIVEEVIQRSSIRVGEFLDIFCPIVHSLREQTSSHDMLSYLNNLSPLNQRLLDPNYLTDRVKNNLGQSLKPFLEPEKITFTEKTNVLVPELIKRLIKEQLIPEKTIRLPRDLKLAVQSGLLPNRTREEDLIQIYYTEEDFPPTLCSPPPLLTFSELKKREQWKDLPQDKIVQLCIEQKLGAYYPTTSGESRDINLWGSDRHDIKICLTYNCGNPFYTTRYAGLERITIPMLEDFRLADTVMANLSSIQRSLGAPTEISFQSTDLEMKHHKCRVMLTKKGISITLDELKFILEEVEVIEKALKPAQLSTSEYASRDQQEVEINRDLQQALKDEDYELEKNKHWAAAINKLKDITYDIKKEGKMATAYSAISVVLEAIKSIDPEFNPMDMPGNVTNFYEFFQKLPYGSSLFPKHRKTGGQQNFHDYCKGKMGKNKKEALCKWGSNPSSDKAYWDDIKT